ncbi:MAG: HAD family hydrolase [Rhodospirillaceae bacterium]|nr:HAD family hydrolase [Rhodospirillaceae bacterium]MBT3809532.1 HAD family hydrolase [Rhodospirillaceae bacterium]MBT4773535.1 HAD family hydrolase [Rhodospirillaceae bacterium]MBT5358023.1 HAD family hydrolase [Rhodospirillaceae bacterium]MBT5769264.1 HAD family hydrolase [Rhodospirillaceae bacterium]
MKALKRKTVFLFDFDGTLMQSNAIKREAFFTAISDHPEAIDTLRHILDGPNPGDRYAVFRELERRLPDIDATERTRAYGDISERAILEAEEVTGASALLETLHDRGAAAVINSATPEAPLREVVAQLRFARWVNSVHGGPAAKAENARQALSKLGQDPHDAVVIGDGENDHACARELNCAFIAIDSDGNDFDTPPAVRAPDLATVLRWLQS